MDDELFVWMLEDMLLTRTVDVRAVSSLADYMQQHPEVIRIDLTTDRLYAGASPGQRPEYEYWGSLDLRFQNDTQYGVLMQAFVTPATGSTRGSITVRVWSTKTYDKVESSELRKSNFTEPQTRTSTGPKPLPSKSRRM